MWWQYALLAALLVAGVLLAFPVAIGICAFFGAVFLTVDRLTTRCPSCGTRSMRLTNGIRETFPTGRGTGTFYLCAACGQRWFWSNDDRQWQEAANPAFNWAFPQRQNPA
jgi:hypothetical protein